MKSLLIPLYLMFAIQRFSNAFRPTVFSFAKTVTKCAMSTLNSINVQLDDCENIDEEAKRFKCKVGEQLNIRILEFTRLGARVELENTGVEALLRNGEILLYESTPKEDNPNEKPLLQVDDVVTGYVANMKPAEGKYEVILRPLKFDRLTQSAEVVYNKLQSSLNQRLPLGDQSTPAEISEYFPGLSRRDFRSAVGRLFKAQFIPRPADNEIMLLAPLTEDTVTVAYSGKAMPFNRDFKEKIRLRYTQRAQTPKATIFLGNLPRNTKTESLKQQLLEALGSTNETLLAVRLAMDYNNTIAAVPAVGAVSTIEDNNNHNHNLPAATETATPTSPGAVEAAVVAGKKPRKSTKKAAAAPPVAPLATHPLSVVQPICRGFAYVDLFDESLAATAMQQWKGLVVGGRKVRIDLANQETAAGAAGKKEGEDAEAIEGEVEVEETGKKAAARAKRQPVKAKIVETASTAVKRSAAARKATMSHEEEEERPAAVRSSSMVKKNNNREEKKDESIDDFLSSLAEVDRKISASLGDNDGEEEEGQAAVRYSRDNGNSNRGGEQSSSRSWQGGRRIAPSSPSSSTSSYRGQDTDRDTDRPSFRGAASGEGSRDRPRGAWEGGQRDRGDRDRSSDRRGDRGDRGSMDRDRNRFPREDRFPSRSSDRFSNDRRGDRSSSIDYNIEQPTEYNREEARSRGRSPLTLFVGNLPYAATEDGIKTFLARSIRSIQEGGEAIRAVRIITDKESGRKRGFAYVDVSDEKAVEQVLQLNEREFMGRPLKIDNKDKR